MASRAMGAMVQVHQARHQVAGALAVFKRAVSYESRYEARLPPRHRPMAFDKPWPKPLLALTANSQCNVRFTLGSQPSTSVNA